MSAAQMTMNLSPAQITRQVSETTDSLCADVSSRDGRERCATAASAESTTYLGWYDGDKKRSVRDKLSDAIARYREKVGDEPTVALLSYADAEAMTDGSPAARAAVRFEQPLDVGDTQLSARAVGYLGRGTFYLGRVER